MNEGMAVDSVLGGAEATALESSRKSEAVSGVFQTRSRYSSPEALFKAQRESLVRALTVSCGDFALAEDSVQEAFARLCVHWKRVSNYDDPATWVRRVALNLTRDHRRLLLRRTRLLIRLGNQPEVAPPAIYKDPHLWEAIRELPARQRTALALYYLAHLKVAEVAATMKVSQGTVKRYLDRARESLRMKLEASHEF